MSRKTNTAKATVHKLPRRDGRYGVLPSDDAWDPLPDEGDKKFVKNVRAWTPNQERLIAAIRKHDVTFAVGPAGTGKTYLAVAEAVEALNSGEVNKIIISRPVVEAGEKLGFLPGDINEKLDPWMRPIFDALSERLGVASLRKYIRDGVIEIAPLAFMRGRTLSNAFIVIDEAQNMTYQQLVMALSRLGFGSTMVITGDPGQTDLLPGMSGLADIVEKVRPSSNVGIA
ncbi:MAG TPA: PhoH family protein, partial [Arenibaculum sp.]|nr:PhoH family protein [Arenibaculum sp.]